MLLSFFREDGLTESQVGLYSGLLEGSFHVGAAVGAVFWGWAADVIGRRPALLLGLMGTIVATLGFGLSPSFGWAMVARIAWGGLNGNVGVAKTVLSEVVPDAHSARAFSFIGMNNGFGRLIGPAMGGLLSEPARKYGFEGPGRIFVTYPYLLPCVIAAAMTAFTAVLAYFVLEETLQLSLAEAAQNRKIAETKSGASHAHRSDVGDDNEDAAHSDGGDDDTVHLMRPAGGKTAETAEGRSSSTAEDVCVPVGASGSITAAPGGPAAGPARVLPPAPTHAAASPPSPLQPRKESFLRSMRRLWNDGPVFSAVMLYALLGLVGLVSNELHPLYVLNGREHGGFGLDSSALGVMASTAGPFLIAFQAFGFEKVVKKAGLVRVQRWNLVLFSFMLATTPLQSLSLLFSKEVQWAILLIHFNITTVCRVAAFIACFIVVANSALPEDRGKVNGLGQAVVSVVRACGPPVWTAIFAWSVSPEAEALGWPFSFPFTWYCQAFLALATLAWTYRLPDWIETKRKPEGEREREREGGGGRGGGRGGGKPK
jgi:MFS family permease